MFFNVYNGLYIMDINGLCNVVLKITMFGETIVVFYGSFADGYLRLGTDIY